MHTYVNTFYIHAYTRIKSLDTYAHAYLHIHMFPYIHTCIHT